MVTTTQFATILIGGALGSATTVVIDKWGEKIGLDTAEKQLALTLGMGIVFIIMAALLLYAVKAYPHAALFLLAFGVPLVFVSLFYYIDPPQPSIVGGTLPYTPITYAPAPAQPISKIEV